MARNIEVTPELLETVAGTIEGYAGEYKTAYEKVYSETDAISNTKWAGKDNQSYINQIGGFKEDLTKMHQLMLSYADFLRKSAKAYRDTQDTITNDAKKLTN